VPITKPSPREKGELARRHQRRISEAISKLACCNMNDTKWREFFDVLLKTPRRNISIRTKMLYNEEPTIEVWMRPATPKWTDSSQGPFENREIEWIEVTGDATDEMLSQLKGFGQLPFVKVENGFRLVAYGPIQVDRKKSTL
jgi:hypothetical protein